MSAALLYLTFAAVSAPLWWPLFRTLLADISAAGELPEPDAPEASTRVRHLGLRAVDADSRAPLHRKLAFQGVARRVAARRRWEGGFGRRGL